MMFQKKDYVVYANEGVCLIDDIRSIEFDRLAAKDYYVLMPIRKNESQIFVPLDSETLLARMRPLLTKEEIDGILDSVVGKRLPWIADRKRRTALFKSICAEMKCERLLLMIGCLTLQKHLLEREGKKLTFADNEALLHGEALINSEFSFSLNIPYEEVPAYIRRRLTPGS